MKQIIRIEDLDKIAGHFIIQVNADKPVRLTDRDIDLSFYLSKRVEFVMFGNTGKEDKTMIKSDLFGNTITVTRDKFVAVFNDYYEDAKDKRYHRLLYADELQVVFNYLLKRNY